MMPPGTSLFEFLQIGMCLARFGQLKIVVSRMIPKGTALDVPRREIRVATLL